MCLVALAIDGSHRFPLIVAANRDEFFDRPTARMAWWSPGPASPDILGGRDLRSGGSWLGLTAAGRIALLTNVRQPGRTEADATSRGEIVPLWLSGGLATDRFWTRIALAGYNGFNLIAADFVRGECFWVSNREAHPVRLERGVYGLSNAQLDSPWPKVISLKRHLTAACTAAESAQGLATMLFEALGDRHIAADAELPATGVSLDVERTLSAAFIRTADQSYGTRCSTIIVTERRRRYLLTHVYERTYTAGSGLALMRQARLKNWPPRYSETSGAAQAAVLEASMADLAAPASPPRKRVRSLLKPDGSRRRKVVDAIARGG